MSAEAVRKLSADLVCPPALSHYADPFPDAPVTSNQLVPYVKDSAKSTEADELNTFDGLFKYYTSFHSMSGDQDKEARTSAYHELMNLMLSQITEDKQFINVSSCPKPEGPFHSHLERKSEFKKKHDKLLLQWTPIKETKRVIDRTLGLYQHGPQPKAGSTFTPWPPPPPVENPWSKDFSPKELPTAHKIPSALPKRCELHDESPLMLKPPTATMVEEIPDAEINKCSSWLDSFAARSSQSSMISSTSMEAVYNFLQKCILFLHASSARDTLKEDVSHLDELLQRANSTVLETQLMSHDVGVTSTELYTHLHMKMISLVLDECQQRDKAAHKKYSTSYSSSRPPRSMAHKLLLDSLNPHRSQDFSTPSGPAISEGAGKEVFLQGPSFILKQKTALH